VFTNKHNAMISPDDKVPYDDSQDLDPEDQQSQQDIHSNGFDEEEEPDYDDSDGEADADRLQQASDASEASYTLNDKDGE
jgi:hypothetical protein